jgi:ABC-type transport system involved in Fe-S cluster assembly fused permease/ATPase subunit
MDAITDTLYTKYNIEYKQISFVGENEEKIIIHDINDKVPLGKKIPIKLPNNGQRTWSKVVFLFEKE